MRQAIAWSYDLLSITEQRILRRLSVYLGEWTLADAEAMTRIDIAGSGAFDEIETIDTLSSLVSKSLIRQVTGRSAGSHFRMLQTLREFNQEQLRECGELDAAFDAQYAWLLEIAERAQPHLVSHRQKEWLDRLEGLHADFRAAFHGFIRQESPDLALRLAKALWRFGYIRSHIREMREMLEQALALAPERTALRADGLNGAGYLANMEGRSDPARAWHQEAYEIGTELQSEVIRGDALLGLGGVAIEFDDFAGARRMYESAAEFYQQCENHRGLSVVSTNLGNLFHAIGDLDRARQSHEIAFQRYTALGDLRGIAWSHTNIGHIATEAGDVPGAIRHLTDAFNHYVELGDVTGYIEVLEAFALIGTRLGDDAQAATMLGAASALRTRIHAPVQTQEHERHAATVSAAREGLGRERFDAAWQQGEPLGIEEMRTLAISTARHWLQREPPAQSSPSPAAAIQLGLTDREMEVLRLLGAGKSDREIAEDLYISVRTVGTHVSNILGKLEVPSRSAAVARALREGVLA
jgi:non-specific serine/threonine protein kinase